MSYVCINEAMIISIQLHIEIVEYIAQRGSVTEWVMAEAPPNSL